VVVCFGPNFCATKFCLLALSYGTFSAQASAGGSRNQASSKTTMIGLESRERSEGEEANGEVRVNRPDPSLPVGLDFV